MENSLRKLSAFKQSPLKIVGNAPIGFPSPWAGWLGFPPPGVPPLPPPGEPPPPPPDGPAPPGAVLDCTWVVMAVVIDMVMMLFSMGQGAGDIA